MKAASQQTAVLSQQKDTTAFLDHRSLVQQLEEVKALAEQADQKALQALQVEAKVSMDRSTILGHLEEMKTAEERKPSIEQLMEVKAAVDGIGGECRAILE